MVRIFRHAWASPATLLGLCLVLAGWLNGGEVCVEEALAFLGLRDLSPAMFE